MPTVIDTADARAVLWFKVAGQFQRRHVVESFIRTHKVRRRRDSLGTPRRERWKHIGAGAFMKNEILRFKSGGTPAIQGRDIPRQVVSRSIYNARKEGNAAGVQHRRKDNAIVWEVSSNQRWKSEWKTEDVEMSVSEGEVEKLFGLFINVEQCAD